MAAFITSQQTKHQVPHAICWRVLEVLPAWYYKWRDQPPTPRQLRRRRLAETIGEIFADSQDTYGSPQVVLELRAQGGQVSVNTVATIRAEQGLVAWPKRRRRA